MKVRDKDRFELAKNYVQRTRTIRKFIVEKGLVSSNSAQDKIGCLEKTERTPSMWITDYNNTFKCFSCGKGGDYLSFVTHYKTAVLGEKTSYNKELQSIVQTDLGLQKELGFNSIYTSEDILDIPISLRQSKIVDVNSWGMLADKLRGFTVADKKQAIRLMQSGKTFLEIESIMLHSTYIHEEETIIEERSDSDINIFENIVL